MWVPLGPGGIALLAPTSTELWRYERALEPRGLPIASQAGKGLFPCAPTADAQHNFLSYEVMIKLTSVCSVSIDVKLEENQT